MRKSRVFIGLTNTANMSMTLAQALKTNNVNADYISLEFSDRTFNFEKAREIFQFKKNTFPSIFGKNITSIINTIILFLYFIFYLFRYNTYIYISPSSFLPGNIDLPVLKFLRKKVVFILAGCPDRDVCFDKHNPDYICNRCNDDEKKKMCYCDNLKKKSSRVQYFEKHCDYIISQDDSAGYLLNKKPLWPFVIAEVPEKKDFLAKYQEEKLVIVHFPSNPLIKLSHIIIPVLERIASENPNIIVTIEPKISHDRVLHDLEEAHILVDALGLGYGVLAVEAMARSCIVVCGEMKFITEKLNDHPIIHANSNNLYEVIMDLINRKSSLKNIAIQSRKFYDQYHSPEAAGKYYKKKLELR